jgi:hypothetical protein
MDTDLLIKGATFVLGGITTTKLIYEWLIGRHRRLRDEYEFAHDFLQHLKDNPDLHPFLKEKGYQAIAGDTRLSASEIEYLLELQDPSRALSDYVLARPYLHHYRTAETQKLMFAKKYESRWSRNWRKCMYFVLYVGLFTLGYSPAFMSLSPTDTGLYMAFMLLLCGPVAILALRAGVRIARAEQLISRQHKHTQPILVS